MCLINPTCSCSKSRHFCWTFNNPQKEPLAIPYQLPTGSNYLLYGHETASTGTPHLQGYIQFLKPTKKCSAILALSNRVTAYRNCFNEVQPCRGSDEDNYNYCTKEGNFTEFGVRAPIGRKEIPRNHLSKLVKDRDLEIWQSFHDHLCTIGEGHTTPSYSYDYYEYILKYNFRIHIYYPYHNEYYNRTLENYIHQYYSKYPKGAAPVPQFEFDEETEEFYLVNG